MVNKNLIRPYFWWVTLGDSLTSYENYPFVQVPSPPQRLDKMLGAGHPSQAKAGRQQLRHSVQAKDQASRMKGCNHVPLELHNVQSKWWRKIIHVQDTTTIINTPFMVLTSVMKGHIQTPLIWLAPPWSTTKEKKIWWTVLGGIFWISKLDPPWRNFGSLEHQQLYLSRDWSSRIQGNLRGAFCLQLPLSPCRFHKEVSRTGEPSQTFWPTLASSTKPFSSRLDDR